MKVTGSPITVSGVIDITCAEGYSIPTNADQNNWNTAFGWGNHANANYATKSELSTASGNFVKKTGDTMSGPLVINPGAGNAYNDGIRISLSEVQWASIAFGSEGATGAPIDGWFVGRNPFKQFIITPDDAGNSTGLTLNKDGDALWRNNKLWHAGNDGTGSGLDADMLDGKHATEFATKTKFVYYGERSQGILVDTDIPASTDTMLEFIVEGNAYNGVDVLFSRVNAYNYDNGNGIITCAAVNYGVHIKEFKLFNHNGVVKMWIPKIGNFITFRASCFTQ